MTNQYTKEECDCYCHISDENKQYFENAPSPCIHCQPTMEHKKSWEEELEKDFYFEGVVYKGQRHWKDNVKNNLVKKFIKNLISSERKAVEKEVREKIKNLKKEIRSKEGTKNPSDWSDTGKVVYYYLSKLEE